MKIWMKPMKGKVHEATARNIVLGEDNEISRPITKDEMDNVIYEEQEIDDDSGDGYQDATIGRCLSA